MTRPLTKRDSNGKTYERPAEIEAAIRSAEQQDAVTLSRLAAISDKSSPDFMPSECLVHLIREARRRDDEEMMNVLLLPLLARCEANLKTKVPNGGIAKAADVREDILSEFSVLFAEDGSPGHLDELDYYECRFNAAFRCLRIDIVRRELARERQRARRLVPVPTEDEAPDNSEDDEVLARIAEDFRQNPTQLPRLFLKELLSAIKSLPEDERNAVVLCRILGYKEESEDTQERTAATICGVSGRTIRNRLGRAAAKLSHLKSKKEA
jgi:DNA-directed RNA polymerase specialized sigma24 family protein